MSARKEKKLPRIAFVKAATTSDFYSITEGSPKDILLTSYKPGPMALYTECDATFLIVNDSRALECRAWKETIYYGKGTFKVLKKYYQHGRKMRENGTAVDLADVDWDSFDIVISFYIAVPSRIVRRHPDILWCYYHWVPCPTYLLSKRFPLFGYNIFLNQWPSYGPMPEEMLERIRRDGKGQVNIPATFLARDTFSKIFPVRTRKGIQVEPRSVLLMSGKEEKDLVKFGPVYGRAPFPDFLAHLCSCKYFIVLKKEMSMFRGNGFIEASSGGCLILAPRNLKVVHPDLIMEECQYDDWKDLLRLLRKLEADKGLYRKYLKKQRDYHHRHIYELPLKELVDARNAFIDGRVTGRHNSFRLRFKSALYFLAYLFNNFILNRMYRLFRGILAIILKPFTRKDPEDWISGIIRKLFGDIF